MQWGKLQGVQEPDCFKNSPQIREGTPVWPIHEECHRKIAFPQRYTQEPRISSDSFIRNIFLSTNFVWKNANIHEGGP